MNQREVTARTKYKEMGMTNMAKYALKVSTAPESASALLKEYEFADFLHEDIINLGGDRKIIILVFEKYFMRVEGRAGITIIIENTGGKTDVRVITAGVGKGMLFGFDWGASDSMINDVRSCLEQYILEESELE